MTIILVKGVAMLYKTAQYIWVLNKYKRLSYIAWQAVLRIDWRSCRDRTSLSLCNQVHTAVIWSWAHSLWCCRTSGCCCLRWHLCSLLHCWTHSSPESELVTGSPGRRSHWAHMELDRKQRIVMATVSEMFVLLDNLIKSKRVFIWYF